MDVFGEIYIIFNPRKKEDLFRLIPFFSFPFFLLLLSIMIISKPMNFSFGIIFRNTPEASCIMY